MEVNSVLEGITEYFLKCPLLKDGVFRVDALGPDPVEYTIETGIFDPVIQRYVDGSGRISVCESEGTGWHPERGVQAVPAR